jgi:DNA-directed RNA polymerase specialized sigma subunit
MGKNYVDGEELKREMLLSRASGEYSERLVEMWKKMSKAIFFTFLSKTEEGYDDFEQECMMHLMLNVVPKFDVSVKGSSLFNYITTCLRNVGNQKYRARMNYEKMLGKFLKHQSDNGQIFN